MTQRVLRHAHCAALSMSRRATLLGIAAFPLLLSGAKTDAQASNTQQEDPSNMERNAFVYTETQANIPFDQVPWDEVNGEIAEQSGFIDKTWLSGRNTNSVGGLYSFSNIEDALKFCTGYFPDLTRRLGVAHSTRVFDNAETAEASADMNAPHFGGNVTQEPRAFVYTDVQVSVPFSKAPWRERNPVLRAQKGLISKVWLSGHNTNTLGGLDAFDTVENALDFAINEFPKTAATLNAAFYTRVFDARVTEAASRGLNSPYYL